ncbi:MAG: hypothetical protein COW52_10130 [Nitrospirae bacterium CG17_big_fil_post_rev_8_21_14_2_50_50_9]|nr:MAG: hypothetical protein AUK29_11000 [Nitrospirae bacterium CG2_30_53_67]PIV83088.1 MAG: hypothetical protein COW52_10130 [Nitrospirae bacterium CG17_big_fil_post_rev_8_21_14_2_50_50_9]
MLRFFRPYLFVLLFLLAAGSGCSSIHESIRSARSSFPLKYFYYPSYETVGAMYKTDPSLAIELLERMSREHPQNLAYRLTLADMYKDRGMANNAIRLWFEILDMSKDKGVLDARNLKVYFIPIVSGQEEGMRPYARMIDKPLVYDHIGMIYFQNAFFEEASDYFSRAAEYAADPKQKAGLYYQAGQAAGSKKVEFFISEKDGKPYRKAGGHTVLVDPALYRKKEKAFYLMALALDMTDKDLREEIEKKLDEADQEILKYEARPGARVSQAN